MFSAVKLWKSSSTSGPSATSKPTSRNSRSMRSRARVTGCRPPGCSPRPSSVTSTRPAVSLRSISAASSTARRASSASCTATLASLMRAPAAGRSAAGSAPSDLSCSVSAPFLPSQCTRTSSRRGTSTLADISASARLVSSVSESIATPATRRETSASGGFQLGLGLFADGSKSRCIVHGQFGHDLAVDFDARLQQAVDQPAVRQSMLAGRRIDAGDPQRTELALLRTTVAVGILPRLDDRLLGRAEYLAAGVVVTLRLGEDFLVSASSNDATLDSCHGGSPRLMVGQQLGHAVDIALVNEARAAGTELALGLARLVAEIVPAAGRIGFESLRRLAKTLGRGPTGLQFGHISTPSCSYRSQDAQPKPHTR